MTDVLLIYPSLELKRFRDDHKFAWAFNGQGYMPLFGIYLGSYLNAHGHSVRILDFELYSSSREEEILREILPNVKYAGISVMTAQVPHALALTKLIKEIAPEVKTIWGGVHPSLMPIETVAHEAVDYVISGEGEEPLLSLMQGREHIRIFSKDKDNELSSCKPYLKPDELPDPDYSLIEVEKYFQMQGDYRNLDFQCSRGCSSKCSFCINTIIENSWRGMDPDRCVKIMRNLKDTYNMRHTFFRDEHFFARKNWVKTFLQGINGLGITLEANMRVDVLAAADDDYLRMIMDAGFVRLRMGAESASDRMLKLMNKHITKEQIIRARDRALEFDMVPMMSFMVQIPDEEPHETEATMRFAEECRESGAIVIGPQRFRPYPGSLEYNKLVDRGVFDIPATLEEWAASELFSTVL